MSSEEQRFFLELSHEELCLVQALVAGSRSSDVGALVASIIVGVLYDRMGKDGINKLLDKVDTLHNEMQSQGACHGTI